MLGIRCPNQLRAKRVISDRVRGINSEKENRNAKVISLKKKKEVQKHYF